jgi:hypothetical protein
MRRPRRARDRRRTAGRVPAQRRAERGGRGVRGEAVNGEHRAMRVSGSTATARGQSGSVSRRRHSHASPLLRLAPSDVDKMKGKALPEATRNRIADWHSYEFSEKKECAHEVRAKNALRFLVMFSFLQKTQIRPRRDPRDPKGGGDARRWRRARVVTSRRYHYRNPPRAPPPAPGTFLRLEVKKHPRAFSPFARIHAALPRLTTSAARSLSSKGTGWSLASAPARSPALSDRRRCVMPREYDSWIKRTSKGGCPSNARRQRSSSSARRARSAPNTGAPCDGVSP